MSHDGPWTDDGTTNLWRNGIRDDALWARLAEQRAANLVLCRQWRDAAMVDGWALHATYSHEPWEHAFTLTRERYCVMGFARPVDPSSNELSVPHLSIWGPDGATVVPPLLYSWPAIVAAAPAHAAS